MADPDEIDARLGFLRQTYGEFPVETGTYDIDPETFERARDRHVRDIPGSARVWVERNGGGEALLVREERRPDAWGVAGGLVEPGERTDTAGLREVREETNVKCIIDGVWGVHLPTFRHENGNELPVEEIGVAFLGTYVDGDPQPEEGEIREVAWWKELPESVSLLADQIGADRL